MAATRQITVGSLVRTADMRSAVNVAMPHRRGTAVEMNAMRILPTLLSGGTAQSPRWLPRRFSGGDPELVGGSVLPASLACCHSRLLNRPLLRS